MSAATDGSGLLRPGTPPATPIPARRATERRRFVRGLWRRWTSAEPFAPPPRSQWPVALRRARIAGLCLLGLQFLGLCWWSGVLAGRYALTWDYAIYAQAAHLIAAGHLDPHSTLLGHAFWRDHAAFAMWPIAYLASLWPHPVTLLWLQDAATVGMEAIALIWICDLAAEMAARRRAALAPVVLVGLGIVLLVADPWMLWASSFDFHIEAFSALFVLAAARDLHLGRRRAWVWAVLALSTGDLGATYLAAVGFSAALSGRRRLKLGAAIALLGAAWFLLLSAIDATQGSSAGVYAQILTGNSTGFVPSGESSLSVISAALAHPGRAAAALWSNRIDLWANLSPGGVLGFAWVPVLVPVALVLGESQFSGHEFAYPGVQNIALAPLVAIGMVALLCKLLGGGPPGRGRRMLAGGLLVALAVNAAVWAVVWVPHAGGRWLTVSAGAARTLRLVERRIKPDQEVLVSQGVAGAFADRESIYTLGTQANLPVRGHTVWAIFAPGQGIELASPGVAYGEVASFARRRGAHLVAASHGIWAFEWDVPSGTARLALPTWQRAHTPAWTIAGEAGASVRAGPPADWHAASTARAGYVVDHAYWREHPGAYRADVTLSVSRSANVEVWNATTSQLLSRQSVPATNGETTVQSDFALARTPPERLFDGWGIWRTDVAEPSGDQIEIRVWSPGGEDIVDVYSVGLARQG